MKIDNNFYNEIKFEDYFENKLCLTEVSLLYLLYKLKNISSKVINIARNKSSNKSTSPMRSSHPFRETSNNFFL